MSFPALYRPNLQQALATLPLSPRSRRALELHGLRTVADFVQMTKERFTKAPGCGERTWHEIEHRVCGYLAGRLGDPDAHREDARPLGPLVGDPEVAQRLADAGLRTVGDFLAMPRAEAQRIPSLKKKRWEELHEAILTTRRQPPAAAPLLPETLRKLPLRAAGVTEPLLQELLDLGCTTVGHALLLPATVFQQGGMLGPGAAITLRLALQQLLRPALEPLEEQPVEPITDWPTLRGRLLAALDDDSRDWFCQRIGLDDAGATPRASIDQPLSDELRNRRDEAVRQRLALRAPSLVQRLRFEYLREIDAFDGLVRCDRLAVGSWLHTLAKGSGDAQLPLRLLAYCLPNEAFVNDGCLSAVPQRTWTKLRQRLRSLTAPRLLPRRLEDLAHELHSVLDPIPRGVLTHMVSELCHLRIHIDEKRGEMVLPAQPELARRLEQLLAERGRPTRFEDLVFDYRERFQVARPLRVLSQLRKDTMFVQLDAETWSLRAWHVDELAQLNNSADAIVRLICERGGKQSIASLHQGDERTRWLVCDLVRHDRRVRWLGRGEACPAQQERSQVLDDLLRDFRRAAGEVPMSRFVQNQPPEKKRLVERLLAQNRLFVFPAPDRIDVLTNYPFSKERLERFTSVVDDFLVARNGYAPLDAVLAEVNRCDLGGGWLHPTLLGELLRRHGPFEVLPGGYVARSVLGLIGWLMRRARTALREANIPITVAELLAQKPELAEFTPCLAELLRHDPLVQTPDGQRFQIA
ncbi:MAG: DNA-directed RNA polymerase subunit alpha C-terminal domain-containing protein [Planctomycetota bacterium]